ncbi:MAG: HAD family phosphatase [Chloroflexota bacterium]|nr:HAD family phosphatase [Chloroflexota bacterium]
MAETAVPIYGCVWDMDGVLVDSGVAHQAAWQQLAAALGYTYDDAMHLRTFGMRNPDIIRLAFGVSEPTAQVAAWGDRKEALFREQARALSPLPGAAALVRDLHAHGWQQAIGSSAPHANIALLLEVLGLAPYFTALVSGDDVQHGKPDPEIFRTGLARLGVAPAHGVVIEDAVAGIQAGVAAGAFTVGVTNTRPRADLLAAGAHLVVDSLAELDAARLMAECVKREA